MQKEYTTIRRFYAWVGFIVCLGFVSLFIWSLVDIDGFINSLVNFLS
jgi:cytosine/uracil/thiamine/allantoin permease